MTDLDAIRARDDEYDLDLARADRRDLLAEVGRLTAVQDDPEWGDIAYAAGIRDERARIRAAVEALPNPLPGWKSDLVYRTAVLAAIEGAEHD
jgi:hypothetical protein